MVKNNEIELYLKDIRKIKRITREEELELARRIKEGDEKAKEELVLANLRFVISVAKGYQNVGIDFLDLINEGNLGLIKAAERYDASTGNKFISYAVWWIKQSILQCINDNSRMIRLPVNLANEILKMKKQQLLQEDSEINTLRYPSVSSFDGMINEDGESITGSILGDEKLLPDTEMIEGESGLTCALKDSMSKLSRLEKFIVNEYYLSEDSLTLDQIGEMLDLSKERVRQIRDKSIRKIRNKSQHLFEFMK